MKKLIALLFMILVSINLVLSLNWFPPSSSSCINNSHVPYTGATNDLTLGNHDLIFNDGNGIVVNNIQSGNTNRLIFDMQNWTIFDYDFYGTYKSIVFGGGTLALYRGSDAKSLDWNIFKLYDALEVNTLDWGNKKLFGNWSIDGQSICLANDTNCPVTNRMNYTNLVLTNQSNTINNSNYGIFNNDTCIVIGNLSYVNQC